jgi:hypothetical protein
VFRKQVAKPERYLWEEPDYNEGEDPFMKHFDEDGNFIEVLPEEDDEDNSHVDMSSKINYIFKDSKKD